MKKFVKSIWFPILLFILLEIISFSIGYFFIEDFALCETCIKGVIDSCNCPSNHMGYQTLIIGTIPSIIISLIVYFLIKKYYK